MTTLSARRRLADPTSGPYRDQWRSSIGQIGQVTNSERGRRGHGQNFCGRRTSRRPRCDRTPRCRGRGTRLDGRSGGRRPPGADRRSPRSGCNTSGRRGRCPGRRPPTPGSNIAMRQAPWPERASSHLDRRSGRSHRSPRDGRSIQNIVVHDAGAFVQNRRSALAMAPSRHSPTRPARARSAKVKPPR